MQRTNYLQIFTNFKLQSDMHDASSAVLNCICMHVDNNFHKVISHFLTILEFSVGKHNDSSSISSSFPISILCV